MLLLERDAELGRVDALVDSVAGGAGRVLFVEGPAGIGKTRLLDATRERARAAGLSTLTARAGEVEREYAFGLVRALYEPALATACAAELLTGPARLAAPVLVLGAADSPAGIAERLHGLYWLTANLADRGPIVLLVDDAHWADEPSLRALAYLAHRIADLPVGLVVAARDDAASDLLAAVRAEPVATVARPGPLSRAGSDALVRTRFAAPAPQFCAACHEACGGNPMLLLALVDALAETPPDDDGVAAVHERAPAIVATSVLPRLRRLPPPAAAVARAVAMLGPDAELRHVAALAGLDHDRAAGAADALAAAGLLAQGRPLTFAHPLVGQVVADHMTPGERHDGHLGAARRLHAEEADPERVAAHLLDVERLGDRWVVAALREAARSALRKGAPTTAVAYLRRAVAEPPDPGARADTRIELGAAQLEIAASDGFATLSEALALAPGAAARARAALVASRAARSASDFRTAGRFLAEVQDRLDELEDALRYRVEAEAVFVHWTDPARRAEMTARARALEHRAAAGGAAGANVLLVLAFDALLGGAVTADRAADLAVRAAGVANDLDEPALGLVAAALNVLLALDRVEPARAALDRAIVVARHRGSLLQLGEATTFRAMLNHRLGMVPDAEADARLADRIAEETAGPSARRWTVAWLVRCLVERGELAEADDILQRSGVPVNLSVLLEARGHLRAAQGRADEALADLLAAGARAGRQLDHPGLVPWRPAAATVLRRLGRLGEARDAADEAVLLARRFAAPRALGMALHARGLVDDAPETLREAVDVLATTPARLEHARATVDLGAALRRANCRTDARKHLEHGMHEAHSCGADALVARAREELTACGARRRRPAATGWDALTPSERRVVQLARDGLSNREIAQTLFVTTKTVETHLGAAYRKLGISRRTELAALP
ncbi:regulatory LuxR family protein [Pseudonocardia hierapolitana]|uniref:Regulatory LuxR family protein n=1 Tax=Pseudonocardia hierapolitana TaxID=1128676 RepID=A0A561SLI6_9PSEU|nr:LuxR family transcriptional regulator [Pseudonocardia hierapolitana]TWF75696.1 regulatory LuxR family protein [Pseudonocardia hierapolitana]